MTELGLFLSAFVSVFALGFQSLNVNHGHYRLAFLTSFAIGGGQLVLMRYVPDASLSQIVATLLGGPFGIVASMHVHHHLVRLKKPWLCVAGLHAWERHTQISFGVRSVFHGWRCKRCFVLRQRSHVPPRPLPAPRRAAPLPHTDIH
jgi:hypothetical protein